MRAPIGSVLTLLLGLALPVACDKGDDGDTKKEEPKTEHSCKIIVAAKIDEAKKNEKYSGNFQSADAKEAEEKAWEDVCNKLPEADKADCKDNGKWQAATGTMEAEVDGAKQTSITITLTRVVKPEEFEAESKNTESKDKACADATAAACKKAGAEGDCVAAGTHEERGRSASSKKG